MDTSKHDDPIEALMAIRRREEKKRKFGAFLNNTALVIRQTGLMCCGYLAITFAEGALFSGESPELKDFEHIDVTNARPAYSESYVAQKRDPATIKIANQFDMTVGEALQKVPNAKGAWQACYTQGLYSVVNEPFFKQQKTKRFREILDQNPHALKPLPNESLGKMANALKLDYKKNNDLAQSIYEDYNPHEDIDFLIFDLERKKMLAEFLLTDRRVQSATDGTYGDLIVNGQSNWSLMSVEDKTALAQYMHDKYAAIYGFGPADVSFEKSQAQYGSYNLLFHTIKIDINAYDNGKFKDFTSTLFHESDHAFMHSQQHHTSDADLNHIFESFAQITRIHGDHRNFKLYMSTPSEQHARTTERFVESVLHGGEHSMKYLDSLGEALDKAKRLKYVSEQPEKALLYSDTYKYAKIADNDKSCREHMLDVAALYHNN